MRAARDKKPGFDSDFNGEQLKIKLRGEIDHHSAVSVRSSIDDMIRRFRPSTLVIDMSAVDFMDSSGLGLIMGRYAVMKELGGKVSVADPTPATEKIMRLAGMERILEITRAGEPIRAQSVPKARERTSGGTKTRQGVTVSASKAAAPSAKVESSASQTGGTTNNGVSSAITGINRDPVKRNARKQSASQSSGAQKSEKTGKKGE